MKHFERLYFGGMLIAIMTFIYSIFTWYIVAYIVGTFSACYAIGWLLDRLGITNKIKGM